MIDRVSILGIDASFIASGGAINHIKNLIEHTNNNNIHFHQIFIWGPSNVLSSIPNKPYVIKKTNYFLNGPKFLKLMWCIFFMKKELNACNIGLLYGLNGINFCRFDFYVGLSQNLLPFVSGQISGFKNFPLIALKLILIKKFQIASYKQSSGYIFLTNYSQSIFNKLLFSRKSSTIIPHGINAIPLPLPNQVSDKNIINLVYVSPIDLYKNHVNVIHAVNMYNHKNSKKIILHLVGGFGTGYKASLSAVRKFHMESDVKFYGQLPPTEVANILGEMDASIFASSCENFPITILETMILKLPLLCSNIRPMTDILQKDAVFFDPLRISSIYSSFLRLNSIETLKNNVHRAHATALKYDWNKASANSFLYLYNVYKEVR